VNPAPPISLERRVRRHVRAPVHEWFAACAPGLEPILAAEMTAVGLSHAGIVPGGVGFAGRLDAGYRANLELGTANRILLRVASFRVRAAEDLFREARRIPWEAFLPAGVPLKIQVVVERSRLSSDGLVEDTLLDAVRARMKGLAAEPFVSSPDREPSAVIQRVFVRLADDRAVLSLDSSGDHLHRRGYRLAASDAPIRETLAAGILRFAGFDGSAPLVDAMCGSGTFAIEAAVIAGRRPPGIRRTFLFEAWPSFLPDTWKHVRRRAGEGGTPGHAIVARDLDPSMLAICRENASRAGCEPVIEAADFFDVGPPEECRPGWIVLNPPYGLRLDAGGSADAFFRRIAVVLRRRWRGWRFVLVVPDPIRPASLGLRIDRHVSLPHGGARVTVVSGLSVECAGSPAL
jgi:23S rRNA G2445 N2-methylase RlmL